MNNHKEICLSFYAQYKAGSDLYKISSHRLMKFSSHHSQDTNKNWSPNSKSPNPRAEVEIMQERQRLLLRMDSGLHLQVTAPPAGHGTPTKESRYPHNDTAPPPQSHGALSQTRYLQQVTIPPGKGYGTLSNRRQQAQQGCNTNSSRQGCKTNQDWGRTVSGDSTLR